MTELRCPLCGSQDVATTERVAEYNAPMGPSVPYRFVENECKACGEAGDFLAVNDANIVEARKQSSVSMVGDVLERLLRLGRSNAYVERALALPSRTLARWKAGECSAAGSTLLRLVATYPWLVEVADHRYEAGFAKRALVGAAAEVLTRNLEQHSVVYDATVTNAGPEMNIHIQLKQQQPHKNPRALGAGTTRAAGPFHDVQVVVGERMLG